MIFGFLVLALVSNFVMMDASAAVITVFTDKPSWDAAVALLPSASTVETEDFNDATLEPGVSVVSDVGFIDNVGVSPCFIVDVWCDQVKFSTQETKWSFSTDVVAYGGNWDLAGPGGTGDGILVAIFPGGGSQVVGTIPGATAGTFYGFTSDMPFMAVNLMIPSTGVETYALDNMVYSFFNQIIGGTDIPINTSALLLAGVQSVSMWMIPVVIAGAGIGVFVIKRRN